MSLQIKFKVEDAQAGERLDKTLAAHPDIGTRSRAEKLIAAGRVMLNDVPLKGSYRCKPGDVYTINWPEPESSALEPWDFPLDIVFEDDALIVINKPSGLVVHPSLGHAQNTLVNALLAHTENLSMGFNEKRPGIVHRLDKETSGLLVVAKTNEAHAHLSAQFKARTVHRVYRALVFGRPLNSQGKVESFLGRHPGDRKRFASLKNLATPNAGKRAVTHYKTLATSKGLSLLECRLETGRTHQIRVHMTELGLPLIGDALYGAKSRVSGIANMPLRTALHKMDRIGLHARELGFTHPVTGKHLQWIAAWPDNLLPILDLLEIESGK